MRIALVSPYSWTYPGGVTRHVEALPASCSAAGHDVRVLAPFDPDDRRAALLHRGARPQARERPDWLVPLGRTLGWHVQRRGLQPRARRRPRSRACARELRAGALRRRARPRARRAGRRLGRADGRRAPLVGTFHCYSESACRRSGRRRASARGAAQPPRRADRRLRGRGVDRPALLRRRATGSSPTASTCPRTARPRRAGARRRRAAADRVRRPGRRAQGPAGPAARLRGAARATSPRELTYRRRRAEDEVEPLLRDRDGVTAPRHASTTTSKHARARATPTCSCAPSLGGESLRHGAHRGVRRRHAGRRLGHRRLPRRRRRRPRRRCSSRAATRPRSPRRCATSRSTRRAARAGRRPPRAAPSATPGRASPPRSSRPTRTRSPCPARGRRASAPRVRIGAAPADGGPRAPAAPAAVARAAAGGAARRGAGARRAALGLAAAARAVGGSWLALAAHRPRPDRPARCVASSPSWVLVALGAHVLLDAAARGRLARDPARRRCPTRGRASRRACRAPRSAC